VTLALATIPKPQPQPDLDSLLLAYFLMFAKCPRKAEPDIDGMYDLQEIGSAPEKDFERLTPYSIARRAR